MAETKCSSSTIDWNAARAAKERKGRLYARVWVEVVTVDQANAKVEVKAASKSGYSTFWVDWNLGNHDVWLECPSTLPSTPPTINDPRVGTPPVNETGYLYLSEKVVNEQALIEEPKWPVRLSGTGSANHHVWLDRLILRRIDESGAPFEIDLLDKVLCHQEQEISLHGRSCTLHLTTKGASALNLATPDQVTAAASTSFDEKNEDSPPAPPVRPR